MDVTDERCICICVSCLRYHGRLFILPHKCRILSKRIACCHSWLWYKYLIGHLYSKSIPMGATERQQGHIEVSYRCNRKLIFMRFTLMILFFFFKFVIKYYITCANLRGIIFNVTFQCLNK